MNLSETTFTATITTDRTSGWHCVVMPGSGEFFGTRMPVKVTATVDGEPMDATMLPVGGGAHMLPLRAAVRRKVGKGLGEVVTVHIRRRQD